MQVMATRALLSFCKRGKKVFENRGFDLIMEAITVGSIECKGLAAAIIGVSATGELKKGANVEIERAVRLLKLLLKAEEATCRERALGALVNTVLLHEQRNKVLTELLEDDELLRLATFIEFLFEQATAGPTCGCQVLATSLLGQLVNNASIRNLISTEERIKLICVMMEKGQTLEVRAAAAGFLWELAYSARGSLVGRSLRNCVSSLVKCLTQGDAQVARNAVGALASFAYKHEEAKNLITGETDTIPTVVKMLTENTDPGVQVQACRLLWILADNHVVNQASIREAGAIPLLSKLLRKIDRQDIVVQAAWAISRLARKCRVNQDSMASPDLQIISSLVGLLKVQAGRGWEVVWEKAAHALAEIANGHEGNQELIVKEEGVVEALVALLRSDTERQRVPIFAAMALRMLAEGNQGDARVIVKNKASLGLKELRDSPLAMKNKQLKTAVEKALRTLDLEN
ncbi:hypothetical protein O6H91_13G032800 [Diphasiastrum complanatum]|uniref:Uncharacterized protein n=1 Tax=Diphasiastrum complanatum TaxID=34168 RepID=A0ACC2BTL3_DIPCM|nr:hypothetical protein O6H91_13G032800 [Diphasiastrum complanatum]